MNASIIAKCKKAITVTLVIVASALLATQASARYPNDYFPVKYMGYNYVMGYGGHKHRLYWDVVPVAICSTATTHSPLPNYVCCELENHEKHVWRDTWVSGSCKNADPRAYSDMGCNIDSPVYTTGKPIVGNCQFSSSTGIYN